MKLLRRFVKIFPVETAVLVMLTAMIAFAVYVLSGRPR